jgi:hypothetical protein
MMTHLTGMKSPVTGVVRLSHRGKNPRKNIGNAGSRKRTESNFLRAFERAYFARVGVGGVAAGEFSLAGFGIADLVWIGWARGSQPDEFTALSLEKKLNRHNVFAFEGKIKDWRRALQQAFRYRYFADKAIVVMPHISSTAALKNLDAFRHACVGFWTFDTTSCVIREHYTPTRIRAFNSKARSKAIRILTSKVNFGQLCK